MNLLIKTQRAPNRSNGNEQFAFLFLLDRVKVECENSPIQLGDKSVKVKI